MSWAVPRGAWRGETCHILGGGKSLAGVDIPGLKGRIVAINDAYLKAPKADLLYFADRRWYDWNRDDLHRYEGPLMVTRAVLRKPTHDVKRIRRTLKVPLSRDPELVAGLCGGANAINLAWLYGCSPIILHGFDMRPGNWHDRHHNAQKPDFALRFMPYLERMAKALAAEGATVLNATPGSLLDCFPMVDIDTLRSAA
jgi:hypothetical protein